MLTAATAVLLAALLPAASAMPAVQKDVASPSCREGFACPGRAGRVEVTLEGFDGSGALSSEAGVLDADEIQCALDCLDGDPDPDHVLAGPRPPRGSTPVRGGVISFDAGVTYRVQRSLRLPAMTDAPFRIEGNGATLAIRRAAPKQSKDPKTPIAVLERRAPPGATNCDVELMAIWASLWTIEDLAISGDASVEDAGLVLHGSNSLTIRNCSFVKLGVGVDLRFALVPEIDQCMFINNQRHDIHLGPGNVDPDRPGGGFARCTTGAKVFTDGGSRGLQLIEGSGSGAVIRHCRFLMTTTQQSSVRLRESRAVVLDGCIFDGYRGKHAVHVSDYLANDVTIRNMYFETNIPSSEGIIRFDGGSRLLVDGLHLVTGVETVAIDVAENPGCFVAMRHVPWFPANVGLRNGTNAHRNEWRLEDVSAVDLDLPIRWKGGPPPRMLVVDRVGKGSRPQTDTTHALKVPVLAPRDTGLALEEGQIWIDRQTKRLMYCCDEAGRPRAVK